MVLSVVDEACFFGFEGARFSLTPALLEVDVVFEEVLKLELFAVLGTNSIIFINMAHNIIIMTPIAVKLINKIFLCLFSFIKSPLSNCYLIKLPVFSF